MPADRKKPAARRPDNGFKQSHFESQFDLKWAPPVEHPPQTIEFTTNVTPTTYTDDTPPPLHPPTAYIFPPEETFSASSETPKPRGRKGSGYIPRPPNAFILFRSSFIKSQHVTSAVETNHSTLSKIIGMTWQNLPNDERQAWHAKAKEAQEEHKRKWPQYAFKPVSHKAQRKKRRVRETEPKDIKRCEKIVELLCNGKKGDELNDAVKDFDKSHVPEFITRFEAPITERAYRRSSSAPLPETDCVQAKQSFLPPSNSVIPHRRRSSSAEPEHLCPSSSADIKLPSLGQIQFDPTYSVGSQVSSHDEYMFASKQVPGFIDFNQYSFDGQIVSDQPCDSFPPLFGMGSSPSPSLDFTLDDYIPHRKPSFGRASLSITTSLLNQWSTPQESPMTSIPSSPSYYSASSPSEIQTPYSDVYTPIHHHMDGTPEIDDSYGFNPMEQGFAYMDSTCSSSPASLNYYPEYITQAPKEEYTNNYASYNKPELSQLDVDYTTYIQHTYSM